jgi:membrane protease YdiL (CAAX protease family)
MRSRCVVSDDGRLVPAPPRYPWLRVLVLTSIVGLLGLATHAGAERLGWEFPSFGSSVAAIAWKLGILGLLWWALRRYEGRGLDAETMGYRARPEDIASRRSRTRIAISAIVLAGAAAFIVPSLPGISDLSAESFGEPVRASLGVVLLELLVRYPLTVIAEESFFRGFLQPRLARWGPVASGVLFAGYHLQQARTIIALIPFGILLGVVRWWQGDVRATSVLHYAANAFFFVSNYV